MVLIPGRVSGANTVDACMLVFVDPFLQTCACLDNLDTRHNRLVYTRDTRHTVLREYPCAWLRIVALVVMESAFGMAIVVAVERACWLSGEGNALRSRRAKGWPRRG